MMSCTNLKKILCINTEKSLHRNLPKQVLVCIYICVDCIFLAESSELRTRTASWLAMRAGRRTQVTDFRQAKSHTNVFHAENLVHYNKTVQVVNDNAAILQ